MDFGRLFGIIEKFCRFGHFLHLVDRFDEWLSIDPSLIVA